MNLVDQKTLENAAVAECTEMGEYWQLLSEIGRYGYLASADFEIALEKEIAVQVKDIQENYEFVDGELIFCPSEKE